MDKKQIENKITKLEEELTKWREELDKPETTVGALGLFIPSNGEEYGYIRNLDIGGELHGMPDGVYPAEGDNRDIGFISEAKAEQFVERITILCELATYDGARDFVEGEMNYSINYSSASGEFFPEWFVYCQAPINVCLSSKKQAEAAIEKLGRNKLKILFGVA